ncbi:MAG: hypothetical protein J0L92_21410 [Deltaproteobacteria bacterium]|nr:hypothetical protein [Deltaproteobacteria bacterium]
MKDARGPSGTLEQVHAQILGAYRTELEAYERQQRLKLGLLAGAFVVGGLAAAVGGLVAYFVLPSMALVVAILAFAVVSIPMSVGARRIQPIRPHPACTAQTAVIAKLRLAPGAHVEFPRSTRSTDPSGPSMVLETTLASGVGVRLERFDQRATQAAGRDVHRRALYEHTHWSDDVLQLRFEPARFPQIVSVAEALQRQFVTPDGRARVELTDTTLTLSTPVVVESSALGAARIPLPVDTMPRKLQQLHAMLDPTPVVDLDGRPPPELR